MMTGPRLLLFLSLSLSLSLLRSFALSLRRSSLPLTRMGEEELMEEERWRQRQIRYLILRTPYSVPTDTA
jgi:hypothetical protein